MSSQVILMLGVGGRMPSPSHPIMLPIVFWLYNQSPGNDATAAKGVKVQNGFVEPHQTFYFFPLPFPLFFPVFFFFFVILEFIFMIFF